MVSKILVNRSVNSVFKWSMFAVALQQKQLDDWCKRDMSSPAVELASESGHSCEYDHRSSGLMVDERAVEVGTQTNIIPHHHNSSVDSSLNGWGLWPNAPKEIISLDKKQTVLCKFVLALYVYYQ